MTGQAARAVAIVIIFVLGIMVGVSIGFDIALIEQTQIGPPAIIVPEPRPMEVRDA